MTKSGLGRPVQGGGLRRLLALRHLRGRRLGRRRHRSLRLLRLRRRPPGSDYFTDPVNSGQPEQQRRHPAGLPALRRRVARLFQRLPPVARSWVGRTATSPTRTRRRTTARTRPSRPTTRTTTSAGRTSLDRASVRRRHGVRAHCQVHALPLRRRHSHSLPLEPVARQLRDHALLHLGTGIHEIKVGGVYKQYPINELFRFGITDPTLQRSGFRRLQPEHRAVRPDAGRDGVPVPASRRTGTYWAGYMQDNIRWKNLTANIGVRYEHNNLPVTDVAVRAARRRGLLHSFDRHGPARHVQPRALHAGVREHPPELLGAGGRDRSAGGQDSRPLGGGVLPVQSERQNAYTVGVQQAARLASSGSTSTTGGGAPRTPATRTSSRTPASSSRSPSRAASTRAGTSASIWRRRAGFSGFVSARPRARHLRSAPGRRSLPRPGVRRRDHGRPVPDRPRPEAADPVGHLLRRRGHRASGSGRTSATTRGSSPTRAPEELLQDPDNAFAAPYVDVHSGTETSIPIGSRPGRSPTSPSGADLREVSHSRSRSRRWC